MAFPSPAPCRPATSQEPPSFCVATSPAWPGWVAGGGRGEVPFPPLRPGPRRFLLFFLLGDPVALGASMELFPFSDAETLKLFAFSDAETSANGGRAEQPRAPGAAAPPPRSPNEAPPPSSPSSSFAAEGVVVVAAPPRPAFPWATHPALPSFDLDGLGPDCAAGGGGGVWVAGGRVVWFPPCPRRLGYRRFLSFFLLDDPGALEALRGLLAFSKTKTSRNGVRGARRRFPSSESTPCPRTPRGTSGPCPQAGMP